MADPSFRRHRDRRGRGLRGALAPSSVPLGRSRSQTFDELVLDAVERLGGRWAEELRAVEFAVEDVPAPDDLGALRLGRTLPATLDHPARIVVYRRPVERRSGGLRARGLLVHDVVVEQVAELLGLEPETVDPDYGDG